MRVLKPNAVLSLEVALNADSNDALPSVNDVVEIELAFRGGFGDFEDRVRPLVVQVSRVDAEA